MLNWKRLYKNMKIIFQRNLKRISIIFLLIESFRTYMIVSNNSVVSQNLDLVKLKYQRICNLLILMNLAKNANKNNYIKISRI